MEDNTINAGMNGAEPDNENEKAQKVTEPQPEETTNLPERISEQTQPHTNVQEEEVAEDEDFEEEELPVLYSDRVIFTFSLLFSVVFGGILFARNLKEVDRRDGIAPVVIFSVIYSLFSIYVLDIAKTGMVGTITLAIIGSTIINTFFWDRYIGRRTPYYRKSYRKPLLIALAIFVPLAILAFCTAMLATQPQGTPGLRIS
jgi:hypothetical protein